MARGKIKIKRIENSTNRQVTYSKRRNGLFKKANELSVLCDATVSIIMLSSTNRVHQFLSPGVTTKEIYDRYQETLGVDIWESHYQKMQEELQQEIETNRALQREIRQRMGDCLEDLSFSELQCLGQSVENAADVIRAHEFKVINNQIGTGKKKVRNVQEINRRYLQHLHNFTKEEPLHGLVDDGEYEQVLGYNGRSHVLALQLQPCPPALHAGPGSGSGSGAGSCVTTSYTLL